MLTHETDALPEFDHGDRVDVTSGVYLGDWGTVVEAPIDMRPECVLVALVRANVRRYVAVTRLQSRNSRHCPTVIQRSTRSR